MKIVVDEMPNTPEECRYSYKYENGRGDKWISCSKGTHACTNVECCPYFVGLKSVKSAG